MQNSHLLAEPRLHGIDMLYQHRRRLRDNVAAAARQGRKCSRSVVIKGGVRGSLQQEKVGLKPS